MYETVGVLAHEKFTARAAKHDLEASTPMENVRDLFGAGMLGLTVSEDIGGLGSDTNGNDLPLYLPAIEQTSRSCMSTGHCRRIHYHGAHYVGQLGTKSQREKILDQVIEKGAPLLYVAGRHARLAPVGLQLEAA